MKIWEALQGDWLYRIEEDLPQVGFYFRGYEAGKDKFDYLQDTALSCMEFAEEEFGVPVDSWHVVQD